MGIFKKKPVQSRRQRLQQSTPPSKDSIYAYSSKRSDRATPLGRNSDKATKKNETRKKRRVVQHIPSLLLVIAILVSVLYLSSVDTNPKISIKRGDDKNTTILREQSAYQEAAQKYIQSSIINRSKLLFDSQGLTNSLKTQFPEIAAVTVTLPIMGRRPVIAIQNTRPAFILVSGNQSVLVGTNGVALLNLSDAKDVANLKLRTVNDESGVTLEPGKSALPQEQAVFISSVVEQLEKQGLTVESLTIPTSPYDLQVKVAGAPYFVKFNILDDPLQQTGSFLALKNKLDKDNVIPKEYIDVRVGERVFYK